MKMMASLTQYQMKTLIVNFFVYQSPDMKRLHRRYGDNLVWLDATYKTCKYSLLLFFLDIQTNVNYQVAAVFVTQEETFEMLWQRYK